MVVWCENVFYFSGEKFLAVSEKDNLTLSSLEVITDALLEIMEVCYLSGFFELLN